MSLESFSLIALDARIVTIYPTLSQIHLLSTLTIRWARAWVQSWMKRRLYSATGVRLSSVSHMRSYALLARPRWKISEPLRFFKLATCLEFASRVRREPSKNPYTRLCVSCAWKRVAQPSPRIFPHPVEICGRLLKSHLNEKVEYVSAAWDNNVLTSKEARRTLEQSGINYLRNGIFGQLPITLN